LPTGGITLENFTDYFTSGAKGVGIGSHFFPKGIIDRQDWDSLSTIYSQFVKRYNDFITET